jgi:hypothetical protein
MWKQNVKCWRGKYREEARRVGEGEVRRGYLFSKIM